MHTTEPTRLDQFKQLLADSWEAYDRVEAQPFVVRPAIPILFFGDSEQYFASPLRVLTVGLNPSRLEFPDSNRFERFPAARSSVMETGLRDASTHLLALNAYFRTKPYKPWFASFDPILNGMECSYYNGYANTALHTDLCSPIATSPTWSGLQKAERDVLRADGHRLWHSLVEILLPDIILISVAEKHLEQIRFRPMSSNEVVFTLARERPYHVRASWLQIGESKKTLQVFGRAAQKPFGTVAGTTKPQIGSAIKEHYYASSR